MDNFSNNILRLAGNLAPKDQLNRVSGAALQMQRELQWFKVTNLSSPFYNLAIKVTSIIRFFFYDPS